MQLPIKDPDKVLLSDSFSRRVDPPPFKRKYTIAAITYIFQFKADSDNRKKCRPQEQHTDQLQQPHHHKRRHAENTDTFEYIYQMHTFHDHQLSAA